MSASNLAASPRSPVGRILRARCPECGGTYRISERGDAACTECGLVLDSSDEVKRRREVAEQVRRNILAARLQELLEDYSISELDVRILRELMRNERRGGCGLTELSRALRVPPSTVQLHLHRLQELGLVR